MRFVFFVLCVCCFLVYLYRGIGSFVVDVSVPCYLYGLYG